MGGGPISRKMGYVTLEWPHIVENPSRLCFSVDSGGIAEQKGLKIGDQIMAVNGYSFEDVTHMEAVEVMKSDRRLVMTVKVSGDDNTDDTG